MYVDLVCARLSSLLLRLFQGALLRRVHEVRHAQCALSACESGMSGMWDTTTGSLVLDAIPCNGYTVFGAELAKGNKPQNWMKGFALTAPEGPQSCVWTIFGRSHVNGSASPSAVELRYSVGAESFKAKVYFDTSCTEWSVRYSPLRGWKRVVHDFICFV